MSVRDVGGDDAGSVMFGAVGPLISAGPEKTGPDQSLGAGCAIVGAPSGMVVAGEDDDPMAACQRAPWSTEPSSGKRFFHTGKKQSGFRQLASGTIGGPA